MKKVFLLFIVGSVIPPVYSQVPYQLHFNKPALKSLFKANDTVGVKNRYHGMLTYIVTGVPYYRDGSKQVMYDCVDLNGKKWMRLPERSIKKKYNN